MRVALDVIAAAVAVAATGPAGFYGRLTWEAYDRRRNAQLIDRSTP